jgi:hypothetical protein
MPLTDAGALVATKQYIGESVNNFSQTNARLGIGDGTVAFAKTQTDLMGTNKLRKAVDAAPIRTGVTLRFSATFGTAEANYPWNEWGAFNAGSGGDMLNRKVESPSLGTKPNTQTWQLVADVAIGA